MATTMLRMSGMDLPAALKNWPNPAAASQASAAFWSTAKRTDQFLRFESLIDAIVHEHQTKPDFRGILFVDQRVATHILSFVLSKDERTASRFSSACIYSSASAATPSLAISAARAKEILAAFACGQCNLLIATNVAEEGMDIPAANCVIRFDPMVHAVSMVQSRGRARQDASSFVVLSQRADRPLAVLQRSEEQQLDMMRTMKPTARDPKAESDAQRARERGAAETLREVAPDQAVAALNLYCSKTKVVLEDRLTQSGASWSCELKYESCLRSHTAVGQASTKAAAKKEAALQLIGMLQAGNSGGSAAAKAAR
eukprot:TRINITY_DN19761_c0_g1_i1.p1 TRINITY_DN19761_c0_g1~~TRINITY_DN19761_c0_g1_i1.p1  ORF type:complete len:314 (-),score=72.79 TRINITY_DN19761_c0_g1_i1:82-1023(-)